MQSNLGSPQACGRESSVSTACQTDTSSSQEEDVTGGFQKALSKKTVIIGQLRAQVADLEERVADLREQLDRERTARQEEEEGGKEPNPACVETHQPELEGGQDITDEAPNPEPRPMEVRTRSPQGEVAGEPGRPTNMPASVVQSTREGGKGRRAPTDSAIRRVNEQRARWKGSEHDTDDDDVSEENDLDDRISADEDGEDVDTEDGADDEHSTTEDRDLEAIISHTRILMQSMFGPTAWNTDQDAIMREASRYGSRTYGVRHANEWALTDLTDSIPDMGKTVGQEYLPRPEVVEACETFIRQHGGLTQAAIVQLASMEEARLNLKRVATHVSAQNPDYIRMERLARPGGGVDVLRPTDFVPNWQCGLETDPRGRATKAGDPAVARMTMESFVAPGLAFVVTEDFARQYIKDTHENPSTWAPKQGKTKGRNCLNASWKPRGGGTTCERLDTDPSDGTPTRPSTPGTTDEPARGQALNSKWLRIAAREEWGTVYHPTIAVIATMIHKAILANGGTADGLLLWKMDLNGAFQLISFRAEDVHLMATRIASDYMVYVMCGTFGWGGTPMAFQVVTRTILWELRNNPELARQGFKGLVEMYVDDLMGICKRTEWEAVERVVRKYCEGLLGDDAVALAKTQAGRRIDGIGYSLDLDEYRVGIASHNVLKALYVNMRVDVEGLVPVRTMEALAAHASRYKTVCPPMAPFSRALHRSYRRAGKHKGSTVRLDEDAQRSVWLMRGLLALSAIQGTEYTRSFASFARVQEEPQWIVEFDGSLKGIGIIWYEVTQAGERAVGCCGLDISWMGLDASDYQNTVEFLAGMLGIRELARRGHKNICVRFRGDSFSALAWSRKDAFRSDLVGNAAIAYVVAKWRSGIEVGSTMHLPHKDEYDWNWRTDWLSRGRTREEVLWHDANDSKVALYEGSKLTASMETWELASWRDLLRFCHPDKALGSQDNFTEWWQGMNAILL